MKVEVLDIPIRHNGSLYNKGESFSIEEKEHERIKLAVKVLEQEDKQEFDLNKPLEEMKLDELKAYAKLKQIDLEGMTKKDDILALLILKGGGHDDGATE